MKSSGYRIAPRAYNLIVLHACKYPASSVNGVILGKVAGGDIEIVDAIPLFHSHLTLPARLEIALAQADAYAQQKGLVVVGYYQGADTVQHINRPDTLAKLVADKIASKFAQACILLIDNAEFKAPFTKCLQIALKAGDDWQLQKESVEAETAGAADLVRDKAYRRLVDFEEHLADIGKDWLNPSL